MTMGSLFDGIGGFPLAASLLGITPIWASEIVPDCISITKRHFPNMKHLGDVTKINGAEIEPVDIITFGTPCQDLSIAGNRKGLAGKRSGLFFEAIRIIKEMRGETNGACPTFAVWENVHGAFSSNKGYDFLSVLDELSAIAEPEISIPRPPQRDGGAVWLNAGAVVGDSWSIAWRVMDAQYWGVPQRRRRIFLVADFAGGRAGEILFKPESVSGNSAEGGETREETAGNTENGVREAIGVDGYNQILTGDVAATLRGSRADGDHTGMVIQGKVWPEKTRALAARADGSPCIDRGQPFIYDARGNGDGKTANTLTGDHENRITDYTALAVHQNQNGEVRAGKVANTLNTNGNANGRNAPLVATFSIQGFGDYKPSDCASSLKSRDAKDSTDLITNNYSVRRLTPLECERLQGLPEGWTEYGHDGKKISDSARYRALGNSLAIPCAEFIMQRIRGAA